MLELIRYIFSIVLLTFVVSQNNRCPNYKDNPKETQLMRQEAIKIQILSKLRINQAVASNITRNKLTFSQRWQVDDWYEEVLSMQHDSGKNKYRGRANDNYYSQTIKVFRWPEHETIISPNTRFYKFDSSLGRYSATGAVLRLTKDLKLTDEEYRKATVKIYKMTAPMADVGGNSPFSTDDLILNKPTHTMRASNINRSKATQEFDLSVTFKRWTEWPERNYGLLICIGSCFDDDPRVRFTDVFKGGLEGDRPLLAIDTLEENHSRRKRSGYDCVNPRVNKKCCRYHYYVKFADLGMDWILAPEGYDAYYCSGDCPFMYLSEQKSSLYYTFVIARANYNNPMASPRPCCTPVSLSDLSIMYSSGKVDSQGQPTDIEIHQLEDMIVDECGCS